MENIIQKAQKKNIYIYTHIFSCCLNGPLKKEPVIFLKKIASGCNLFVQLFKNAYFCRMEVLM